jgi:hypothetical protein
MYRSCRVVCINYRRERRSSGFGTRWRKGGPLFRYDKNRLRRGFFRKLLLIIINIHEISKYTVALMAEIESPFMCGRKDVGTDKHRRVPPLHAPRFLSGHGVPMFYFS